MSLSPALLMHECINSREKSYECDYKNCGKKLTQLVQIEAHKRFHTKRKPYGRPFNG